MFSADGDDVAAVASLADRLRQEVVGDTITYVVNRNINYTNICLYRCGFCAFSKGSTRDMRGPAYRLDFEEIGRRSEEHTSELQSLMRISYAVFCLKKKNRTEATHNLSQKTLTIL